MRIVVLSDIHANATALSAAVNLISELAPDQVVVLGDLLTYGVHPARTLDLLSSLSENYSTSFVLGNHDEIYLDLLAGNNTQYSSLAPWVRECVDWTLANIDQATLLHFPWVRQLRIADIYLAHANPFGDWSYLNDSHDMVRATQILTEHHGFSFGVFGHTHRAGLWDLASNGHMTDRWESSRTPVCTVGPALMNPGSVGQPRGGRELSSILLLQRRAQARVELLRVSYDVGTHTQAILNETSLGHATRQRLLTFFHPWLNGAD